MSKKFIALLSLPFAIALSSCSGSYETPYLNHEASTAQEQNSTSSTAEENDNSSDTGESENADNTDNTVDDTESSNQNDDSTSNGNNLGIEDEFEPVEPETASSELVNTVDKVQAGYAQAIETGKYEKACDYVYHEAGESKESCVTYYQENDTKDVLSYDLSEMESALDAGEGVLKFWSPPKKEGMGRAMIITFKQNDAGQWKLDF